MPPIPRSRLLEALPLLLVALFAIGVMAVTFVILQRTARLRASIATEIEQISSLTDTVEMAVARQAVAVQNLMLDPDSLRRREDAAARALEDSAMGTLTGPRRSGVGRP